MAAPKGSMAVLLILQYPGAMFGCFEWQPLPGFPAADTNPIIFCEIFVFEVDFTVASFYNESVKIYTQEW